MEDYRGQADDLGHCDRVQGWIGISHRWREGEVQRAYELQSGAESFFTNIRVGSAATKSRILLVWICGVYLELKLAGPATLVW